MKKITLLLFLSVFCIINAQTTHSVNSLASFNTALDNASSGDIVEWTNGTYSNVYMNIDVAGITVKAETPGGVIFNGSSRVEIKQAADNVVFSGFQYVGGDIGTSHVARIYGSNVLFENVNISEYTCYKYLIIQDSSQYTIVKNCNFEHRVNNPDQNILSILVSSSQAGFHKVQYCSFKNFDGEPDDSGSIGDAGVEPIRIGVSSTAEYASKSIIEYCYFTACNGDGEIISHKAKECVYRYNTFENNPSSELVLRHGDNGIVYGNFFLNNKGGVRIQEASNHVVYNNYFNGLTSRSIYLSDDDSDPVENVLIAYNTVVNSKKVELSGGGDDTAPSGTTLANNIFSNTGSDDLIDDATGTEQWYGNIYNGTLGITVPTSGLSSQDPELSLNAEGYYTIASTSPAISNAVGGYPALPIFTDFNYDNDISLDILGNNRPELETAKDVGCQELDPSAVLTAHVTEENTGPDYDLATLSTSNSEELISQNFSVYPNPLTDDTVNVNFTIEEEASVNISIYSLTGEKITTIVDSVYNIGSYDISKSVNLSSGVYALKIELSTGVNTAVKVEKLLKK